MKFVYWFEELHRDDLAIAGGKGANLGEMTQKGFPVPPGFAVAVPAYYEAIKANGLDEFIKSQIEGIGGDLEDSVALEAASQAIKDKISSIAIPKPIEDSIKAAYVQLCKSYGKDDVLVAIRSSATAEDLPTASFAGQQATFLNISGVDQVVSAVRDCWASLFEARAIYYRSKNGFDHLRVGLCAIVQVMIQSQVSGVMFTADPISGRRDRIVIESGLGLGEAIVSGLISPDMYLLDKNSLKILNKTISKQSMAIRREASGETKEVHVDKFAGSQQKLDDPHIIELAGIGKRIEEAYGGSPQDIEWALDPKGDLFIVQTRAITTLKEEGPEQIEHLDQKDNKEIILAQGLPASPGIVSGPVRIIRERRDLSKVQPNDILVAPMTSPDYVPVMKRAAAIVTDAGGLTCHAAIVARELGIPCIVGTGNATSALPLGKHVTVDATHGVVYSGKVVKVEAEKVGKQAAPATDSALPEIITATKVYINIADPDVAERVASASSLADGVGLIRAEFMISALGTHPNLLAEQGKSELFIDSLAGSLRRIAAAFHPRPVIYRANDFKSNEYRGLPGGEKFEPESEGNPMMGFRGCLRYIKDPTVFLMELEAIKRVRDSHQLRNIHLMIPFVRTVSEFKAVLEICRKSGLEGSADFRIGMMCEIPSNVILADEFCRAGAQFMSIGSNDLAQLTLGADRDSALVASDFDERDPAVVKSIKKVIKKCHRHGVTVSICGQLPSTHPDSIPILVRAGIDGISVNPDALLTTKRLVASAEHKLLLDSARSAKRV